MALINLSGFPSSGKSKRAHQIKQYLQAKIQDPTYTGPIKTISILSDHTLDTPRTVYSDSRAEKPARAALFTAIQRQINRDTVLIVDALNYIKGFRYQIYCVAREIKVRMCTVYVVATHELCRQWNHERPADQRYLAATLDGLLLRYEEPSSMVRWDSPLFTVPWTDEDIPGAEIWEAITEGNIKPPNSGTLSVAKAPTDALHCLEQTTMTLVSLIMAEQAAQQGGGFVAVLPLSANVKLEVQIPPRNLTLSELQRLKRQFISVHRKAITLGTTERGAVDWSEESIAQKFVTYLEEHMKP